MSSPAERFAASRRRAQAERSQLHRFRAVVGFELDAFQEEACEALESGRGVLVAAPTGAGKTVVGEFAVHLALAEGRKAFYTTPIKALSNQKHAELTARFGEGRVGLLTGDTAINADAPVVVMTTEVLRNMLYADSPALVGLGHVVMDEVHYLADRARGAVWEEVIIHLPDDVLITSLSATVSNAEEFGAWLATVRGETAVVVSEHRPVPLWQHVMVGQRLLDLFVDADTARGEDGELLPVPASAGTAPQPVSGLEINPELVRLTRDTARQDKHAARGGSGARGAPRGVRRTQQRRDDRGGHGGGSGGGGPRRPPSGADRAGVVERLDAAGLLPVITFVFSRAGCDAAVRQCVNLGVRLTTEAERAEVLAIVDERCSAVPDADRQVLGYWEWLDGLGRGLAAHHAGMLPAFKEVVEELFSRGLVKAVFATETLALGINMPARSVVLERLVKFNGEAHVDITPGEYTQLTGRAGRRGIDVEGHAVVVWAPGLDAEQVAGLASTRTYPLRSSFRPTYNMAVNLVGQVGRTRAREVLETSFAQFQADRGVVGMARQLRQQEEALAGYATSMRCHLGDFAEYARMRARLSELEKDVSRGAARERRSAAVASMERWRVGDVVHVPAGRRSGYAVVLDPGLSAGFEGPRPTVLTAERQVRTLTVGDVPSPVAPVARVRVAKTFDPRNPRSRSDLAAAVRSALAEGYQDRDLPGDGPADRGAGHGGERLGQRAAREGVAPGGGGAVPELEVDRVKRQLRQHPCHSCPDREDHARWSERWGRLEKETRTLRSRISGRTGTIARTFDRVCDLLVDLGYLAVTPPSDRAADGGGESTAHGAGASEDGGSREGAGVSVTRAGQRLRRVYAEKDLLVAQCLRVGAWEDLDPAGLAAVLSAVVFEARREEGAPPAKLPGGPAVTAALKETVEQWSRLTDLEHAHQLPQTGEPDLGLVWPVWRWAQGQSLEDVLDAGPQGLAAGDFVRWCRQLLDLLDQVSGVAAASGHPGDAEVARTARRAAALVDRGVINYSAGRAGAL